MKYEQSFFMEGTGSILVMLENKVYHIAEGGAADTTQF